MVKISGPVNLAILKGSINGINKNIHIYGDIHYDEEDQSSCKGNALTIDKYLIKKFKENEKSEKTTFDLFVEIDKKDIHEKSYRNSKTYLDKMRYLIVKYRKKMKHTRFHYFDARGELEDFILAYMDITDQLEDMSYNSMEDIDSFIELLEELHYESTDAMKILNRNSNFRKTKDRYKHKEVERILSKKYKKMYSDVKKFRKILKSGIEKVEKIDLKHKKFTSYAKHSVIMENVFYPLFKILSEIEFFFNKNIMMPMADVYLLRRILDKDYIENAIVYCGLYHMKHVMGILIKDFGFKLKYIDYPKNDRNLVNKLINHDLNKDFLDKYHSEEGVGDEEQCLHI